jgi:hypothetical protein
VAFELCFWVMMVVLYEGRSFIFRVCQKVLISEFSEGTRVLYATALLDIEIKHIWNVSSKPGPMRFNGNL